MYMYISMYVYSLSFEVFLAKLLMPKFHLSYFRFKANCMEDIQVRKLQYNSSLRGDN